MNCARTGRLEAVRGRAAFQPSWQGNVCFWLRQIKIPMPALSIYAPSDWTASEAATSTRSARRGHRGHSQKLSPRFRTIQICPKDLLPTAREALACGRPAARVRRLMVVTPGRERPMSEIRRREFISLLGAAATAWPRAARAQQPDRVRRVGVLMGIADDLEGQARIAVFRQALQALGWTEGRNIQLIYRWSAGDAVQARRFAKELLDLRSDVLLVNSTP